MALDRTGYAHYEDEALIPLISGGDAAAFKELYERYGQKMFSFFFRMLWKNKELAEDNVQELFIRVMKHAGGIDTTRSFSTWLYSIANNMCKNEYRKEETRSKYRIMAKPGKTSISEANLDLALFRKAVHQCTEQMDAERKALFVLRFQEQLSVPDISRILDIPEGTVKSRIFYLLKEMKDQLRDFQTISLYP
jgi:RNA polymerase sigma-70 factor (ECF subfamily)